MSQPFYRFQVGQIECTALLDRQTPSSEERVLQVYTSAPREELLQAFRAMGPAPQSGVNCLLIRTRTETVLVDTGIGLGAAGDSGSIFDCLDEMGVARGDIGTVMISHCHFDHVGGILDQEGKPSFPHARYLCGKMEWEYWNQDSVLEPMAERGQMLRGILAAMQTNLHLVEPEAEIAPCVQTVAVYGHTPGHMGLFLDSEGQRLLVLVDALHSPMQMQHPEWSPNFDVQPALSPVTRRAMLARAADTGVLTSFYHLPFPGLGYVTRQGDAFAWQPIG